MQKLPRNTPRLGIRDVAAFLPTPSLCLLDGVWRSAAADSSSSCFMHLCLAWGSQACASPRCPGRHSHAGGRGFWKHVLVRAAMDGTVMTGGGGFFVSMCQSALYPGWHPFLRLAPAPAVCGSMRSRHGWRGPLLMNVFAACVGCPTLVPGMWVVWVIHVPFHLCMADPSFRGQLEALHNMLINLHPDAQHPLLRLLAPSATLTPTGSDQIVAAAAHARAALPPHCVAVVGAVCGLRRPRPAAAGSVNTQAHTPICTHTHLFYLQPLLVIASKHAVHNWSHVSHLP